MADEQNYLEMSDEDIMNMAAPATPAEPAAETTTTVEETPAGGEGGSDKQVETSTDEVEKDTAQVNDDGADPEGEDDQATASEAKDGEGNEPAAKQDVAEPAQKGQEQGEKPSGTKEKDPSPTGSDKGAVTTPDYEGFYKKVMAPLRANGRTIEIRTPEEALQLMQMGANYTKKMQAIQPHRKVLLMLENNGLLDEGKLSFLIDIEKKNPEAIKKLIKDAGIDPLEIDTSTEPTYQEGNHRVSDEEAVLVSALEDVKSAPGGIETLTAINTDWDQASKDVLWKNPELLNVIHQQRTAGIYEIIGNEVNRRKTLGLIPANVSFIQAYKAVGDELDAAGAFQSLVQKPVQSNAAKQPVVTTVAKPKSAVANNDKASAASPTRSTPRNATPIVNPLALSDDEFMKGFEGRL